MGRVPTINAATVISFRSSALRPGREKPFQVHQAGSVFRQRMAGNVKSEHGVFTGEAFFLAPGRGLTQFERHRRGGSGGSEQTRAGRTRAFGKRACKAATASSTEASMDSRGPSESTAPDLMRLSNTRLFREARFDTFAEIVKGFELSLDSAAIHESPWRCLANILDGSKTEANGFPDGREVEIALIHIGRENGNTHPRASLMYFTTFSVFAGFRGQERGHEFDGIMRFFR